MFINVKKTTAAAAHRATSIGFIYLIVKSVGKPEKQTILMGRICCIPCHMLPPFHLPLTYPQPSDFIYNLD